MEFVKVQASGITKKYSFRSNDGHLVKAAFVQRPEKSILCLSTQIGCVGQCKFCSAYDRPLVRSLRIEEMVDMVNQICSRSGIVDTSKSLLISFMGTGEPLANTDSVLRAIQDFGSQVRFALSVSGYSIHQVQRLPTCIKVQFTLVSANQYIRNFLQPNVDSLLDLRAAAEYYSGPREFNVPLIEGYNDDYEAIKQIAVFVKSSGNIPVKLNKYHPMNGFESSERVEDCLEVLKEQGCEAEYYETDGADIYAACGQFELGE